MGKGQEKGKEKGPDIQVTKDWTRPHPLKVDGRNPEKSYRWVDKKKYESRNNEGWRAVDPESVRYSKNNNDGSYEGAPQHRELVLMEMPRKMADQRNKFYRDRAGGSLEAAKNQYGMEVENKGFGTIGV